jgi:ectoine hydroxylase-related dioxygenase (phytanoyl-CoA dioxygenase family)
MGLTFSGVEASTRRAIGDGAAAMRALRRAMRRLADRNRRSAAVHIQTAADANGAPVAGVTSEERVAYRDIGFFIRERVFGADDLTRLREAVEDIHRRIIAADVSDADVKRIDGRKFQTILGSAVKWEWNEEQTAIRSMEPVHHLSSAVDEIIDDERLCIPISGLLGVERLSLFTDKLNFKRPGGAPFPWHQDAPYWAFGCTHLDRLVSVQIYLDDATIENGCLWVIPASHTCGHIKAPENSGVLGRLYTDVREIGGAEPQPLTATAGSVIFFDGYIVHGSKSNHSSSHRRALILTYQPSGLPVWNSEAERVPVKHRAGLLAD